ncbi:hypothetical protein SCP_0201010 [Sparassis crispa]|uniref:Uncharacterized protein n=1 Tax=Sparassis crispa TaxID=139825 RepID=A0A401G9Q2_9APHY|nr:hypothetical protein SCP_0201010 [Sparassis crispa]GBE78904.1 hypothetical protein SCP_0201010 [Sparassis crispa]
MLRHYRSHKSGSTSGILPPFGSIIGDADQLSSPAYISSPPVAFSSMSGTAPRGSPAYYWNDSDCEDVSESYIANDDDDSAPEEVNGSSTRARVGSCTLYGVGKELCRF